MSDPNPDPAAGESRTAVRHPILRLLPLPLAPLIVLGTSGTLPWIDAVMTLLVLLYALLVVILPASRYVGRRTLLRCVLIGALSCAAIVLLATVAGRLYWPARFLSAGFLVFTGSLVLIGIARFSASRGWTSGSRKNRAAAVSGGTLAAAGSVAISVLVAGQALGSIDGPLSRRVAEIADRSTPDPERSVEALVALGEGHDDEWAHTFSPRLFLTSTQHGWPYNPVVDALNSQVWGSDHKPRSRVKDPAQLGRACGPGNPRCNATLSDRCFFLDERCDLATGSKRWPYGIYIPPGSGIVYSPYGVLSARVIHRNYPGSDQLTVAEQSHLFAHVAPVERAFEERVTHVIQYWLYYPYDYWQTDMLVGNFAQEHESDWEYIELGFSDTRPLFVAYSAHCGGQWLPWTDVPAVKASPIETETVRSIARAVEPGTAADLVTALAVASESERTHPAVMVAEGSQANYPASGSLRVPDGLGCIVGRRLGDVATLAANGIERVRLDIEVIPAGVYLSRPQLPPMVFHGHWGFNRRISVTLAGHRFYVPLAGDVHSVGTVTPSLKPEWSDPFTKIFTSKDWKRGEDPSS